MVTQRKTLTRAAFPVAVQGMLPAMLLAGIDTHDGLDSAEA